MKLLRRRPKSFDIQVQDMVLHITASPDLAEESRPGPRAGGLSARDKAAGRPLRRRPPTTLPHRVSVLPPPLTRRVRGLAAERKLANLASGAGVR